MGFESQTQERIVLAALELFLAQGIRKTAVDEVAARAGVTRITVYRHFTGKRALARAAFLRLERVFQEGLAGLSGDQDVDAEVQLDWIGQALSALPSGDLPTRLDELRRLYPGVFAEFQEVQTAALNGIFDRLFTIAEQQGRLRPGLRRDVVQTVFWEMVVNLLENPRLRALGLSNVEAYRAVKDILLYGILSEKRSQTQNQEGNPEI